MPVLWQAAAMEAEGVIGEAMKAVEDAQTDLYNMVIAWGGLIVGGIAYFFSGPASPAGGGSSGAGDLPQDISMTDGTNDINITYTENVDMNDDGSGGGPPPA